MLRLIFISCFLLSVLTIGIPVENPVTDFSYSLMRRFGVDVSMTPITFDMSMMTDETGELVYQKAFDVVVMPMGQNDIKLSFNHLDFYRHKVPINLYFEILGYGGILPEGKEFLCRSLGDIVQRKLTGFELLLRRPLTAAKGFNELQVCP